MGTSINKLANFRPELTFIYDLNCNLVNMRHSLMIIFFLFSGILIAQELELVVQKGHNEPVKSIGFSPDGKFLVTGSRDKTAILWEVATGREIRTFHGHGHTVTAITFHPTRSLLFTGSADEKVYVWDYKTGKMIKSFKAHGDIITSIALDGTGTRLAVGGYGFFAEVWDWEKGDKLAYFKVNPEKGNGTGITMRFSPDNQFLAVGQDNRTIELYDPRTWEKVLENKPAEGWCGGCGGYPAFTSDSKSVYNVRNTNAIVKLDIKDAKETEIGNTINKRFRGSALSPDDKQLYAFTSDSVFCWNTATGKIRYAIKPEVENRLTEISLSPNGKVLALSSDDGSAILLNALSGDPIRKLEGLLRKADKGGLDYDPTSRWDFYIRKYVSVRNDFSISPDGQFLLKGKSGTTARLWNIQSGKLVQEFRGHDKAVLCNAFTHDGKKVVTGGADGTVRLWDVETGSEIRRFRGHRDVVFSIDILPGDSLMVTGSWDGSAQIWEVNTGKQVTVLTLQESAPFDARFTKNGLYVIAAGLGEDLKLWEPDTKKEVRLFTGHTDKVQEIGVGPGPHQFFTAGWDGTVRGWDMGTGLQNMKLQAHEGGAHTVTLSPDEKQLATGGADRMVKIWSPEDGRLIQTYGPFQSPVSMVRYTPNQKFLIVSGDDGSIRIIDLEKNEELFTMIFIGRNDWMVINRQGYFYATDAALKEIVFVRGVESFQVEQFFDTYFRPDLLKESFGVRGSGSKSLIEQLQKSPPPRVTIRSPQYGEKTSVGEMKIIAQVEDNGGGVGDFRITQNGKVVDPPIQKGGTKNQIEFFVDLVPGLNEIGISAQSKGGISSDPAEVLVAYQQREKSANLYLFAIGIDTYRNPSLNLNFAKADAVAFASTIKEKSPNLFANVHQVILVDEQATRQGILSRLDSLSGVINPDDVFVFYFAGHGSMVDNEFYFIPTENTRLYQSEKLKKEAIPALEMQEYFTRIKALKQVVVIDACQSGGSAELLAQRGATEEKAMAQLARSAGIHVLSAAGSEQFATEFQELGHGLFTYVLLQALTGKADGSPKDGKITIYELKSYIDDQVPELSRQYKGKMQFPYTFSRGHDFPILTD